MVDHTKAVTLDPLSRTVPPAGGHKSRDIPLFDPAELDVQLAEEAPSTPCPEDTESLVPWLRNQFPEVTPRTSDREVIDKCIARAGLIDLINHIEASLDAAREAQKDAS